MWKWYHIHWIWLWSSVISAISSAVAEERHVTRAAERWGCSSLRSASRFVERELDVQLFRRLPRGVELTDAGAALLADARAILSHVDHAFATTRRTARGEQDQVAVGFTSSAPFNPFVPRIIRAYRDAFPLISFTLDEGGTTDLIDDLPAKGSTPRSFAPRSPIRKGLSSARCCRRRWSWPCRTDMLLRAAKTRARASP